MTPPLRLVLLGLLVAALAIWNMTLTPDRAARWVRSLLVVPGVWAAVSLYGRMALRHRRRTGMTPQEDQAMRRYLESTAMWLGTLLGLLQLTANVLALSAAYGLPGATARRLWAVAAGLFIIAFGNMLPKIVTPLSLVPAVSAARLEAARRFAGRVWVLLGITLLVTAILAPVEMVTFARGWIGASCVVTTLLAIVWMHLPQRARAGHA